MKKNILYILLIINISILAQKQTNVWYFGNTGAGINFNTCPPTVLTNGWNNQNNPLFEGSTAISDANGNLLFYSNGNAVFNANHLMMPNGTSIGPGNTQTQNIIIPKPGSNSLYYLFTPQIQAFSGTAIVAYSVINMTLNAGLGDVISSNTVLRDTIGRKGTEKLTAVKHANGMDFWLIGHDYYTNKFFCYLITSAGINPVPVETSIGPVITDPINQSHFPAIGELKASPDGSKLGFTCLGDGVTAIFQFNNSTGVVSNPITLNINDGAASCSGYGTSFSPDNSKFYVNSTLQGLPMGPEIRLFQFDLSTWNSVSISNSRYTVNSGPIATYYSMKLGPNKKLYMSKGYSSYLAVIHSPNSLGAACNYVDLGFSLGMAGSWGLNNAIEMFDSLIANSISITASSPSICAGSTVNLVANGSTTYSWLPSNNFIGSNASSITVTPNITTTYSVNSINTANPECITGTSFSVIVNPLPTVSITASQLTVCAGSTVALVANGGLTYTWLPTANFPGSNSFSIIATPSTPISTYSVNAANNNCMAGTSFSLQAIPAPIIIINANQTTICSGSDLILTASGANSYTWSSGFAGNSISIAPSTNTVYTVMTQNQNGCVGTSSIQISVASCMGFYESQMVEAGIVIFPNPNSGQFTVKCTSHMQLRMYNGTGQEIINIYNLAGTSEINVTERIVPGIYFIEASNERSIFKQKIVITR